MRVLVGSGDRASSLVPELERDNIREDRTEGDRDMVCCSANDCCEVEVERFKLGLLLLAVDILFESRWLSIRGAAISSLTGAGSSSSPCSSAVPGEDGTANSSSS